MGDGIEYVCVVSVSGCAGEADGAVGCEAYGVRGWARGVGDAEV